MMNPGNVRPQPGEDPNVVPAPQGPEILVPGWTDEPSSLPSTDPEAPNGVPRDPDDNPDAPPEAPEDPEKEDPDKDDGPDKEDDPDKEEDPDKHDDPEKKDGEPDTEEGDDDEEEPGEEPDDLSDRKLTVVADFPMECPLPEEEAPPEIPGEWTMPDEKAA